MITLLGVGHVFDIGRSIRSEILARRPKVVALELDPVRYHALMSRTPRARGISPLALLAQFQIRIARQYGVEVGDEMIAAAQAAQEIGSEIALIDQDSRAILRRGWEGMFPPARGQGPGSAPPGVVFPPGRGAGRMSRVAREGAD